MQSQGLGYWIYHLKKRTGVENGRRAFIGECGWCNNCQIGKFENDFEELSWSFEQ